MATPEETPMRNSTYGDLLDDLRVPTRELRHMDPATWEGFAHLHRAAMADGELSSVAKELIALAIAVTTQCDGCVASHARAAARAGATPAQVAEALGVCLLMAGGPASVYAPRAWEAFREFSVDARDDTDPRLPVVAGASADLTPEPSG
ncbi:MAG TPA: carboxymuconolactone decarboxylase family protein [Acidimicrobiales bacterium]